ncbi:MAG: hypothetical protein KA391_01375 [Luteimonas sp.]|nr:hypothetical protein [Luteimonas sp.]
MRHRLPVLSAAILLVLCACSGAPDDRPSQIESAVRAVHAEYARMQAQGSEATAREITELEFPVYRELMQASGLDAALGGKSEGEAALRELFVAYERKARSLQDELPRMLPMAYTGIDLGYSGLATSLITGGLQNAAAIETWDRAQQNGETTGSHSQTAGDGSQFSMQWDDSHASSTTVFEGTLPGGLQGKVTTKVDITTCPDASGKVNVSFTSESEIRASGQAGTGAHVKVSADLDKYLDDDANLIDDQIDMDVHVDQRTFDNYEGSFVDITDTLSTSRGEMGSKVNKRSGKANDAAMQSAEGIAKMAKMAALQALEGAKKGWESGRCVDLQVTSSPGKRTGVTPGTSFKVEAKPRARSDGAPTGGSVTATLSGGSSIEPGGKVRADATYTYKAPEEKDKSASIAFESRSKRGVGKATAEFDTKAQRAYHASGGGGAFHGSGTICDLEKPFTISGSGVTMTFTPSSAQGGSYSYSGSISGFAVWGGTGYTVSADENGGTMNGSGVGCVKTPKGTRCANGTEKYTLTPTDPCEQE